MHSGGSATMRATYMPTIPTLFFLYGPPAVGKLTIGQALARKTGFPLLDNHSIANPIADVFGWDHPERRRLSHQFRLEIFAAAIQEGLSLITTFGGGRDPFIQETRETVKAAGGKIVFVRLLAPRAVLLERVQEASRRHYKKMITPEALQEQCEKFPDIFARMDIPEQVEIDTSLHSVDASVEMILDQAKKEESQIT